MQGHKHSGTQRVVGGPTAGEASNSGAYNIGYSLIQDIMTGYVSDGTRNK